MLKKEEEEEKKGKGEERKLPQCVTVHFAIRYFLKKKAVHLHACNGRFIPRDVILFCLIHQIFRAELLFIILHVSAARTLLFPRVIFGGAW